MILQRIRVALSRVAAIEAEAALEPTDTFFAGAMGKLRFVAMAEGVVTDGVRRLRRFGEVVVRDRHVFLGGVPPYTGEAVCLQFDTH